MNMISGDPSMFSYHQDGKLTGIVCIHVDDLLILGNESFKQVLTRKLFTALQFFKLEQNKFLYLGCEIEKNKSGFP